VGLGPAPLDELPLRVDDLKADDLIIIITSTYGKGHAPTNAANFAKKMQALPVILSHPEIQHTLTLLHHLAMKSTRP